MDIINEIEEHPQKVEVVHELKAKVESSPENPLNIIFPSDFIQLSGAVFSLRTYPSNTSSWAFVRPVGSGNYNLCVGSCVASNQGANIVVPLNIVYYNLSSSKLNSFIEDISNNLPLLFPAGTTIRFTYSTIDFQSNTHFYVVSVQ